MTFLIKTAGEQLVVKTGKYDFIDCPAGDAGLNITLDDKYTERMHQIFGGNEHGPKVLNVDVIFKNDMFVTKLTECTLVSSTFNGELDAVGYNIIFVRCMHEPPRSSEYVFVDKNYSKTATSKALLQDRCVIIT